MIYAIVFVLILLFNIYNYTEYLGEEGENRTKIFVYYDEPKDLIEEDKKEKKKHNKNKD